ncbi:unnamed protein product [Closterium sp. Yama58-4]|nr:unnamed protein product [Closterium sp. Yama58-4]
MQRLPWLTWECTMRVTPRRQQRWNGGRERSGGDADHGAGRQPARQLRRCRRALRCYTLPRAVAKAGRGVQVWWNGLAGGSKGSSSKGAAACKQVQFFANPACKGKALDEVLKPQYAGLRKFFNMPSKKKVARWTSVACRAEEVTHQCPTNTTWGKDDKGVEGCVCDKGFVLSEDGDGRCVGACDSWDCGEISHCEVDNGEPVCYCNRGVKVDGGEDCENLYREDS